MKIVKAVLTCPCSPTQWDAWTDTGQYLYLRYRYGRGRVERQPGPDTSTWVLGHWLTDASGRLKEYVYAPDVLVAEFDTERGKYDGVISLEEFCQFADIELALAEPEDRKMWD